MADQPAVRLPSLRDGRAALIACGFVAVCYLGVFSPQIAQLAESWAGSEDNSHGFLIPFVSLYFAWMMRKDLAAVEVKPAWWGGLVVAASLAGYVVGMYAEVSTLASLSLVLCLAGLVVYYFGLKFLGKLWFPMMFLLFMIPIPSQIYSSLTIPLQLLVTKLSVVIVGALGIPIHGDGNVIFLPDLRLNVVNACSGLRSMTALLAMSALFAWMVSVGPVFRLVLFASGVPISIAVNVIRVSISAALAYWFGAGMTEGPVHEGLGILIFVLAFCCLWILRLGFVTIERLLSASRQSS